MQLFLAFLHQDTTNYDKCMCRTKLRPKTDQQRVVRKILSRKKNEYSGIVIFFSRFLLRGIFICFSHVENLSPDLMKECSKVFEALLLFLLMDKNLKEINPLVNFKNLLRLHNESSAFSKKTITICLELC